MLVERWLTSSVEDRESAHISRRYCVPGSFIMLLYRNWCYHRLEMAVSESPDCCKGCQATCCIWCGMWDGYGFNLGEICFILCWLGLHQSILHSWGDISVLLLLWQCSWGFSWVPSGKSRFLTSLTGNMELLSMKCRGIRPHLAARGKSHEFSRVPAGTWCISSSYGGDGHLKLGFFSEVRTPV